MEKYDAMYKTGSTERIEKPPEEDRATVTSNVHMKFGEVWMCGSGVMSADRLIDRSTERLVTNSH